MNKKIVIFLLALLVPIVKADGFYCKYSDLAKYKWLASNINTYYEYYETENEITFSINIVNMNEDLYIIDTTNNKRYNYKSNEFQISGYVPGQLVKYNVYTDKNNCSGELLYTIRVKLPDYNPYYKDNICDGMDNYIYCQKWYRHNLNYDSFIKKVQDYKESLKKDIVDEEPIVDEEYGIIQILIQIWIEYYYIFLISIILVCGVTIYVTNKKSNIYK